MVQVRVQATASGGEEYVHWGLALCFSALFLRLYLSLLFSLVAKPISSSSELASSQAANLPLLSSDSPLKNTP